MGDIQGRPTPRSHLSLSVLLATSTPPHTHPFVLYVTPHLHHHQSLRPLLPPPHLPNQTLLFYSFPSV